MRVGFGFGLKMKNCALDVGVHRAITGTVRRLYEPLNVILPPIVHFTKCCHCFRCSFFPGNNAMQLSLGWSNCSIMVVKTF